MGRLEFTRIVLRSFYFGKHFGEAAVGQTVTHEEHQVRDLCSCEHLNCTHLKWDMHELDVNYVEMELGLDGFTQTKISWLHTQISGIQPMKAWSPRWPQALREYGTKWPLIPLDPVLDTVAAPRVTQPPTAELVQHVSTVPESQWALIKYCHSNWTTGPLQNKHTAYLVLYLSAKSILYSHCLILKIRNCPPCQLLSLSF